MRMSQVRIQIKLQSLSSFRLECVVRRFIGENLASNPTVNADSPLITSHINAQLPLKQTQSGFVSLSSIIRFGCER